MAFVARALPLRVVRAFSEPHRLRKHGELRHVAQHTLVGKPPNWVRHLSRREAPAKPRGRAWRAHSERKELAKFIDSNRERIRDLLRDAAHLRRAAGKPPPACNTRSDTVRVVGEPERRESGVVVRAQVEQAEVRVFIFLDGTLLDDCDDWDKVRSDERDSAMRAAVDWALEDPPRARTMGLDPDLIDELWR